MKILFSLTYYLPYISGLSIHVQKVAEGLKERGYGVRILTSQYDKSLKKNENIDGITVTRVPYLAKFHKGVIMPAWLWVGAKEVFLSDTIICNLPQPESILLLFLARLLGKKAIVVYHCDINLPKGFLNYLAENFLYLINDLSCRISNHIISTSEDYAKHSPILKKFIKKTSYVYPPIKDLTTLKISLKEKEKISSFFEGVQNKIGFVGRMAADKGVEYLLDAIPYLRKKIKNFKVFLAGPREAVGESGYVKKINFLIQKYRDNVCFLGILSDSQLAWFYRNIDVFVLPSINSTEAFGTVQIEAMFFGVPVVASDLPGVAIAVNVTGMGEIVRQRDSKKISDAIVKIIENKTTSLKTKEFVKKIFSLERTINDYEKLFKI